jgi:hypothetical protein
MMNVPTTAIQFNDQFQSQEACLEFLAQLRWPKGFVCPNCNHDDGYQLASRPLIQCTVCRHQTSITSGTLFHKTRIPLQTWFYMIYSMAHDKGGTSSSRLAAELGMHQTTVWHMLHKIRHAMGRRDQPIMLAGFIEMDEAIIGPHARRPTGPRSKSSPNETQSEGEMCRKQPGRGRPKKSGSNEKTQTPVLCLVEQEPSHAGFLAVRVLEHVNRQETLDFVEARVDRFQHIKTDAFPTHHVLRTFDCTYEAVPCSGPEGCIQLPIVHRAIMLMKEFLMGTYFGVSVKYLQPYLNEFAFRFNRRDIKYPLWFSLLRACVSALPFAYAELTS